MVMSFLRPIRLVVGLIALVAIGWAQTFGLHRGYACDCGGVEAFTQVDHCHGPHSTACHEEGNEDHAIPHQHDEEEEDGDTHPHAVVVDSLVAKQQNDDFSFSLAVPVRALDAQALWECAVHMPPQLQHQAPTPPPRAGPALAASAWPRLLAQTIALRI